VTSHPSGGVFGGGGPQCCSTTSQEYPDPQAGLQIPAHPAKAFRGVNMNTKPNKNKKNKIPKTFFNTFSYKKYNAYFQKEI
jgi:hypothetical protein